MVGCRAAAPKAGILSFRLGYADGVSVAAAGLAGSLGALGFDTVTVAGEGLADRIVRGLTRSSGGPPDARELRSALADLDLVVVENLLTLPLHPCGSRVVADVLAGRPTVVRHHDPPWQRERFTAVDGFPANDPAWAHAAVCDYTRDELRHRGIGAVTLPVTVRGPGPVAGRRRFRQRLGVRDGEVLCLHPVRAIPRKEIPAAIELVERIGGVYWLTGPAEEGYEAQARSVLENARVRTLWRGFDDVGVDLAYAAADLVVFPSSWEGFGIPPVEAALHRRPTIVGSYPVAAEFRAKGFDWPFPGDVDRLRSLLRDDVARARLVERNFRVAERHFTQAALTRSLGRLLAERDWMPPTAQRFRA